MKDGAHDTAMAELFQEDAAFATQYLNDVLAQGDQADLLIALRQMAQAYLAERLSSARVDPALRGIVESMLHRP